eukprot:CAMPEP_0173346684 /NCGR_PEP_ID=MMETSP1144-20121109/12700_1 /TAXON_ID=483371 /ORGANISM="non described non described, Strain CCMP2298" /LENGTH=117 /DNA_ID=CAMNT_0014294017 /DNA_START=250 /DNA_END=600 /DNA_ORIENTATION=-
MAEFLLDFDHKSLSPQDYRGKFLHFLQQYALPHVTHVVLSGGPKSHHSVQVRCQDVIQFDMALAHCLLRHPRDLLPLFEEALWELQIALQGHPATLKAQQLQRAQQRAQAQAGVKRE